MYQYEYLFVSLVDVKSHFVQILNYSSLFSRAIVPAEPSVKKKTQFVV